MHSTQIRRAKTARKFGIGLMATGVLPIAWFIASSLHPALPAMPSTWVAGEALLPLHRVPWLSHPIGLVYALASLALVWLGATIVARQKAVFEAESRDIEDRMRRVREYGSDGRIEPFIGSPISIDADREPS
jgi:hypothetical protein